MNQDMKRVTIPLVIAVAAIFALEACGEHVEENPIGDTATAAVAPGSVIIFARSRDGRLQVFVDVAGRHPLRPEPAPHAAPPLGGSGLLLETAAVCPNSASSFSVDVPRR